MKEEKSTILVPWDFSERAQDALLHAKRVAKQMNNKIELLHITDSAKLNADAEEKLQVDADQFLKDSGLDYSVKVINGSIFKKISEYAAKINALMVIMGTHGIKGLQKITGSWAVKVMSGSKVPFYVVQDKPLDEESFSDIVFPVDFTSESKEKVNWAVMVGKYFNTKVHVFKSPITDASLNKKVNINLNFAVRFFEQHGIAYDIKVGKDSSEFAKEILEYAADIKADLVMITMGKGLKLFSPQEQYLIANGSKIPVMCVNPHSNQTGSSWLLSQ